MENRIKAVVLGKPQGDNIDIDKWVSEIKDDRWGSLGYIERGFDIVYSENDYNIIQKLYIANGFDVVVCLSNGEPFEKQFPNLYGLKHKIVDNKIVLMSDSADPKEIGAEILNTFYYNMENFTDNKECVTVFTPCYNTSYEEFMRLYKSLCNQTYTSWEWFILDDSDNGVGVEKYIEEVKDFRIRCIKNITNHGNVGYNKRLLAMGAQNEYLLEVDHDDELLPNCLEKIHEAFMKYPECGFCYSNVFEIGEGNMPILYGDGWGYYQGSEIEMPLYGAIQKVNWQCDINEVSIRHIISAPNHLRCWRSDVYRKIYGHNYNYSIADDYELMVRTFLETEMCFITDYLYIQHEEKPTTQRHRNKEIQRCVECIYQLYDKRIHNRILELGFEDSLWVEERNGSDMSLATHRIKQKFNKTL